MDNAIARGPGAHAQDCSLVGRRIKTHVISQSTIILKNWTEAIKMPVYTAQNFKLYKQIDKLFMCVAMVYS